jgi:hypothetical protein
MSQSCVIAECATKQYEAVQLSYFGVGQFFTGTRELSQLIVCPSAGFIWYGIMRGIPQIGGALGGTAIIRCIFLVSLEDLNLSSVPYRLGLLLWPASCYFPQGI